jgi:hypothetical protein
MEMPQKEEFFGTLISVIHTAESVLKLCGLFSSGILQNDAWIFSVNKISHTHRIWAHVLIVWDCLKSQFFGFLRVTHTFPSVYSY